MAETIKLDDRSFNFTFKDKAFEVSEATNGQSMEYAKAFKEIEKDDSDKQSELMLNFLVNLGMPEELKKQLPPRHLKTIIEAVTAQKKS